MRSVRPLTILANFVRRLETVSDPNNTRSESETTSARQKVTAASFAIFESPSALSNFPKENLDAAAAAALLPAFAAVDEELAAVLPVAVNS